MEPQIAAVVRTLAVVGSSAFSNGLGFVWRHGFQCFCQPFGNMMQHLDASPIDWSWNHLQMEKARPPVRTMTRVRSGLIVVELCVAGRTRCPGHLEDVTGLVGAVFQLVFVWYLPQIWADSVASLIEVTLFVHIAVGFQISQHRPQLRSWSPSNGPPFSKEQKCFASSFNCKAAALMLAS